MLFHPQYDLRQVENVKPAHRKPIHVRDYIAYGLVQFSRWSFDKITGYSPKTSLTPEGWLQRFIFLETVAGVPGMVGAMLRHMMFCARSSAIMAGFTPCLKRRRTSACTCSPF